MNRESMIAEATVRHGISPDRKVGVVESIEYTSGGAGNQWTTIDGEKYATYWEFSQGVRKGAVVVYHAYKQMLWYAGPVVPHAGIIEVVGVPS